MNVLLKYETVYGMTRYIIRLLYMFVFAYKLKRNNSHYAKITTNMIQLMKYTALPDTTNTVIL